MEIWKDIIGYEGLYQISSFGNVKSFKNNKIRFLKPGMAGNGYLTVALSKLNKAKTFTIHQLVAINFLNHLPQKYVLIVNHKDLNKLNNNVNNLEIITARENLNQKHLKSSSKYTGVCWDKHANKWRSFIRIENKLIGLGSFDNELDASNAYQKKLNEIIKN